MRCLRSGFLVFLYELFTSDQYAIVVVRRYLLHFAQLCLLTVVLCEILLHIPLVYDIPSIPSPDISDPTLHLAFIASIIGIAVVVQVIRILITIMYQHTKRRGAYEERKFYEDSTFLSDSVIVKPDDAKELRYYPRLGYDDYLRRGVGFYGSTLGGELLTSFTVGSEWIFNILSKVFVIVYNIEILKIACIDIQNVRKNGILWNSVTNAQRFLFLGYQHIFWNLYQCPVWSY